VITGLVNRNFRHAATWCAITSVFFWFGLMHSDVMRWAAQPRFAVGWLSAAVLMYSGRWWACVDKPAAARAAPRRHRLPDRPMLGIDLNRLGSNFGEGQPITVAPDSRRLAAVSLRRLRALTQSLRTVSQLERAIR
jgi:hypothetical protein